MKKKLVTLAVLALAAVAFSQETRFSLRYGLDMSFLDIDTKIPVLKTDTNGLAGFYFGMTMDMCGDLFCFQPGFMFRQRGGELIKEGNEWSSGQSERHAYVEKETTKMWSLEWPIMLSLRVPFGEIAALRVSAGPYLAFGLFGGVEIKHESAISSRKSFEKTFKKDYFSRFDAGANIGCGVDLQSFYVGISYSLGLVDISQKNNKNIKEVYNRALGITLDYYL